jgi:hypothetical protein
MGGLERASGNMHMTRFFEFLDKIEEMIFADGLAQVTAWILFIGGIIAWPITAKTMFKHEPQGILGLSFLAIIYTGYQILQYMHKQKKLEKKVDKSD